MNRREFTQMLTVGAGSLGLAAPDEIAFAGDDADDRPRGDGVTPLPSEAPPENPVTVDDYRQIARTKLPHATDEYIAHGSADGHTLRANVGDLQQIRIVPPLLRGVGAPDLSTTVLGTRISMPIMLAPVAALRLYHPDGALAAARGAHAVGTLQGVSSSAYHSIEEIAAATPGPKWYQFYLTRDRHVARRVIERVEAAGYRALMLTVDLGEWKDCDRRNKFSIPREMLLKHLRDIGFELSDSLTDDEMWAFNLQAWDMALTWDLFGWVRSITKLPLVIKGVLRPDDARKAVQLGIEGIIVSNHGGRKLDGMPSSIRMLPGVVEAVGGRAEVYMDSGIRRGTDVLKALALGARAVLIGRAQAWGLAADGEHGVRRVLELLRDETANAMATCGCATVADLGRDLLLEG